MKIELHFLIL